MFSRFLSHLLVATVALATAVRAEDAATAPPIVPAPAVAKVTETMQTLVDDGKVSGSIAIVSHRGRITYFDAVGVRDLDSGKPMERDTIVRIYSMTKPITSVAAMMLVEQGKFEEETVAEMTRDQLPKEAYPISIGGRARDGVGFGLRFSVIAEQTDYTRLNHLHEYGWGGAASTHFWISAKDDLAVVVLTQLQPYSPQLEIALKPVIF